MICDGCQTETYQLTGLTWPDGSARGRFCEVCRDWISKGHRASPVVMIGSRWDDGGKYEGRTYRNDTTGDFYTLTRSTLPDSKPFFVALVFKGGDISRTGIPISPTWTERWGFDFSWPKAERAFIKQLQKEKS